MLNFKKALRVVIFLVGVIYGAYYINENWGPYILENAYIEFRETANIYYLTIATLIFGLSLFFHEPDKGAVSPSEQDEKENILFFTKSFFPIVFGLIVIVTLTNQHGLFTGNRFNNIFVDNASRRIKIDAFQELPRNQEIVVLGSSKAFYISAEHIRNQTSKNAFNFSVNANHPTDSLAILDFLLKNNPRGAPKLLIVEVRRPSLQTNFQNMPIDLAMHLPPFWTIKILASIFDDVVSKQSIVDSTYILAWANKLDELESRFTFSKKGTRLPYKVNRTRYRENLRTGSGLNAHEYRCDELDPNGTSALTDFVELAKLNNVKILFYRSPINQAILGKIDFSSPQISGCETLLDSFMIALTKKNPNVQYLDLFLEKSIGELGYAAYNDAHHLNPEGALLLTDILIEKINSMIK